MRQKRERITGNEEKLVLLPESARSFLSILYLRFHQNCSAIVLGSPIESKLSLPLKFGNQSRLISVTRTALVSAAGSHQPAGSAARTVWKRGVFLMSFNLLIQSTNGHLYQQPSPLDHLFFPFPDSWTMAFTSQHPLVNVRKQHNSNCNRNNVGSHILTILKGFCWRSVSVTAVSWSLDRTPLWLRRCTRAALSLGCSPISGCSSNRL